MGNGFALCLPTPQLHIHTIYSILDKQLTKLMPAVAMGSRLGSRDGLISAEKFGEIWQTKRQRNHEFHEKRGESTQNRARRWLDRAEPFDPDPSPTHLEDTTPKMPPIQDSQPGTTEGSENGEQWETVRMGNNGR